MRVNLFWRAREPVWRLEHTFLNRDAQRARELKNQAWRATYISNQALLTHTSNITYGNQVLGSSNKIPPTVRVV